MATEIASAPAQKALRTLYAYAADPANENPAACEAIELDRQIGERERTLVALVSPGRRPLQPDADFHCASPDPRTTQCDGVVADGTGQPDALRLSKSPPARVDFVARLVSHLPDARLIALYKTSRADVLEGRAAVRLDLAKPIRMSARSGGAVLIALFSAPQPYKVRKLVWYY